MADFVGPRPSDAPCSGSVQAECDEILVSVVVAARNVETVVGECLDSVLGQTYTNFEIIVADDCSSDRTWEVLSSYAMRDSRVVLLRNEQQLFAAATRNRCLSAAGGDYVMIQDADDVAAPTRMQLLVDALRDRTLDFVSSGWYLFDENGTTRVNVPVGRVVRRTEFLIGSPFCHAATMFTRRCLDSVGGYRVSAETRRGQDYDLFMRLYAAGFTGANISDVLYGYRVDRAALARRMFRHRLDECQIRRRGFAALGLMPWGAPFVLKPLVSHALRGLMGR